ncbi:MAG: DHA2 family efflux MFS transporter permease subunit [Saprospiraceae bacterium]|nr:DHA2 family efflux MFS transporter permease subunit [Saprospiraceae bacterium]
MASKGFTKFIVVATTISAAIMELLDTSIVNVALFNMAGSLGVNVEDVAWVITSYAIANVIIIPLTGFLGNYFGRKNYYIFSMILFTIASYMCGESTTLLNLVIWRFIQGIGGGALLSTSQAILFDAFEPQDRAIAGGIFGMGVVLGPTLGPTVGGWVMEHMNWPWIFFINLPIGVLATYLSYNFIEKKPDEGKHKSNIQIDYGGILLLMIAVGSLQYVLERGEAEDWYASRTIQILTVSAFFGTIAFIWRELTIPNPAVRLSILKDRTLGFTNIMSFVLGIGLFTSVYVFPVLVQRINGFTPYETGLAILFPTLVGIFLFPIIGKMMASGVSPTPFIILGCILFIIFGFYGGTMTGEANRFDFFYVLVLRTFGISLMQLPLINQAVAGLPPQDYPSAIAINNMIRQLGGAFGIALANNFVASHYAQHRSDLVSNAYATNPAFTERFSATVQSLTARTGDALNATELAYRQISFAVDKQAYLLSYLDTFRLVSYFFIAVFPLIFVIRSAKKKSIETDTEALKAALEDAH